MPNSSPCPSGNSQAHATLLAALLLITPSIHAQSPPGADVLQRESEGALQPLRPKPPAVASPAPRALDENAKATRITIRAIRIDGASLISSSELETLVADRIGQSLTLAELEHTAQRIAEHYRQRGWFARVYLPQQDITDGTVRIHVLEGRYGGSRLDNNAKRADSEYVHSIVTHRLQPGDALSATDLERGLLLANDLPGIRTTGLLEAGDAQGETRLAVTVDDTPFITGDLGASNHGVKATGRAQASAGIALNNPTGRGDQLAIRTLAGENIRTARISYGLPLGHDGLRLSVHASTLDYELGDRYKALDAEGKAHTGGLSLTYPLLRQQGRNLALSADIEHRRYDDNMLDAALRRHRINAITLGISGDRRDNVLGGAITWGGIRLTHGTLTIQEVGGDKAADKTGPRTNGDYTHLGFQLNRLQALGANGWQILAALSGQLAANNLSGSEKFSLGGPNRIRAYPVNEANGDQGLLFKLELQRELGQGWQAIAFYDTGRIQQHRNTWTGWQGAGNQPNTYSLSGAGLGLNWRNEGWTLAASAARPVNGNPGKDVSGHNNDGSKASSARYWLSLNRIF